MNDEIYKIVDGVKIKLTNDELAQLKEQQKQIAASMLEYEKTSYARKRASEYPSIGDQLDSLFKAGLYPEEMAAKIQAVKDKYPKPEGV